MQLCLQCISNLLSMEVFPLPLLPQTKNMLRFVTFRWLMHSLTGIYLFIIVDSVLLLLIAVPQ